MWSANHCTCISAQCHNGIWQFIYLHYFFITRLSGCKYKGIHFAFWSHWTLFFCYLAVYKEVPLNIQKQLCLPHLNSILQNMGGALCFTLFSLFYFVILKEENQYSNIKKHIFSCSRSCETTGLGVFCVWISLQTKKKKCEANWYLNEANNRLEHFSSFLFFWY